MHPDVPEPFSMKGFGWWKSSQARAWHFVRRRLFPFVLALLFPEWVLIFSISQFISASFLKLEAKHLSLNQTFFIVMGGFHGREAKPARTPGIEMFNPLGPTESQPITVGNNSVPTEEDEVSYHPLDKFDVLQLLKAKQLQIPRSREIEDKSKHDQIAKLLVLVQTIWFVTQCVGRKIQHLPLTKLEIVTLAYIIINIATYAFWWKKPYCVEEAVRIVYKEPMEQEKRPLRKRTSKPSTEIIKVVMYTISGEGSLKAFGKAFRDRKARRIIVALISFVASIVVLTVSGALFGAVHFLAWSRPSQLLWNNCFGAYSQ
ncbi:SubName: Full=Uncharacterized protein {ECO:0000313/EMBL:CCA75537.1} [Serendipita indica DSM 11827]|nr:SubName: Full=Uncharacterized protein {ECO:0000313/EMBL:CCA75537.1} [Serendipita indica DSM 11827]